MTQANLNQTMIVLAREYRGLSQNELASKISISPGQLCKIEKGLAYPPDNVIEEISDVLNLPTSFFYRKGEIVNHTLHYRKKVKVSPKILSFAEAEMNLHRLNVQELLDSVEINSDPLPNFDLNEFDSPSTVAKQLRQLWKVAKGPIHKLFHLIERNGVIIIHTDLGSNEISGRSMFTEDKKPIIFINKNHVVDRQRFTLAHELGHLIMHINQVIPDSRDIEKEANEFASEFLLPLDELRAFVFGYLNIEQLAELKRYWKVSMQAILYKAKEGGLITPTNFKSMMIEFSKQKIRINEPKILEPEPEYPQLLNGLIKMHLNELQLTLEELSQIVKLNTNEFTSKYLEINKFKLKLVV